jgi:hypothetical protein
VHGRRGLRRDGQREGDQAGEREQAEHGSHNARRGGFLRSGAPPTRSRGFRRATSTRPVACAA